MDAGSVTLAGDLEPVPPTDIAGTLDAGSVSLTGDLGGATNIAGTLDAGAVSLAGDLDAIPPCRHSGRNGRWAGFPYGRLGGSDGPCRDGRCWFAVSLAGDLEAGPAD